MLEGGAGNDSLTGGDGDDYYVFNPANGSSRNLGADTITEAANDDSDTLDFTAFSSTEGVSIDLSYTASSQIVHSGVLTLTLATYDTGIENVLGGDGADSIIGNSRDNLIDGGAGSDSALRVAPVRIRSSAAMATTGSGAAPATTSSWSRRRRQIERLRPFRRYHQRRLRLSRRRQWQRHPQWTGR